MDSNRAAAKAAPCKILLRITANLTTRVCPAKSAPQRVATGTNLAFLFSARAGRPRTAGRYSLTTGHTGCRHPTGLRKKKSFLRP